VDRMVIAGIEVSGHHGVLPDERQEGQRFVVDVELELDLSAAAALDRLEATVDYAALVGEVAAIVGGEPCELIETVAARVAGRCLDDDRVVAVEVTVHKPDAPLPAPAGDVAVTLRRERS